MEKRTVVLAVTGSVAAYKAAALARLLVQAGLRVVPVMTRSAERFLGPLSLAAITGEAVVADMFDPSVPGEVHVALSAAADVVVVAPATADALARFAAGRADDLVAALVLCARGPVLAAPAMHPRMWEHPATQRNVADLEDQGRVRMVGPVSGEVASGDVGTGRMAEPEAIAAAVLTALAPQDLAGLCMVVTAGPTLEDLDPVRFLGNRSSGKMGFALAERAAARGAQVTLVTGPVALPTPRGVTRVDVRGALAMEVALAEALGPDLDRADALVMAAAVADHRPAETSPTKLKKTGEHETLALVRNPDLLAELGEARAARRGARPVLVGFAVETASGEALVTYARGKLTQKRVDLVVANAASDSFGKDDNRAVLVTAGDAITLDPMPKSALADRVLDRVRALLAR